MTEIFVCTVFWAFVLWHFGSWVYRMSWRERRGLVFGAATYGLVLWAIAHFGISFPE